MSTYAMSKPTYGVAIPVNPFGVTFYVSNTTNPTEDQGSPGPTAAGRTPKNPFGTVAAAITAARAGRGDTIVIQRGTYTEDLDFSKAGLTVRAAQNSAGPDHVVIVGTTQVTAAGCTFEGIEFQSGSATYPCVQVGTFDDAASTVTSTVFSRCSFSSDGTTEPEAGVLVFGSLNTWMHDCRFTDLTFGVNIHPSTGENPYGVHIVRCHFNEITTAAISDLQGSFDATLEVASAGGVGQDFLVKDCVFGLPAPTDFVNISSAGPDAGGTGVMAGNFFASATNASSTITIPAGILYPTNYTEAGASTARPA